ncbi:hypothetical protein KEM56_004388, partial [Ascosphaera pollenicola]
MKLRSSHHVFKVGDPFEKLNGSDRRAYKPWRRSIFQKIQDDLPQYLFQSDQVNYAITQVSGTGSPQNAMSRPAKSLSTNVRSTQSSRSHYVLVSIS